MGSFSYNVVLNTRFDILRRSLHVLSLIQHSHNEDWNMKTLADILSLIPGEGMVSEKSVATCVDRLKEMGFPVKTDKGARRIYLERELTEDEMLETLSYYLNATIDPMGLYDCFKSYVQLNKSRSLWTIARIYFASLQRRKIKIEYHSETCQKGEYREYLLHPYQWVYRDNAVYLVAFHAPRGETLFRLNRMRDLTVLDDSFDEAMPEISDLFRSSLGAFFCKEEHRIILAYHVSEHDHIVEDFGRLNLSFNEKGDEREEVSFIACDLVSVCRVVFGRGGKVRIISPVEAIDEMKRLIKGNSLHYQ